MLWGALEKNPMTDPSSKATLWVKAQPEAALTSRASSGNNRGFHTQLDEGPETP